jgi:hypothetical protein
LGAVTLFTIHSSKAALSYTPGDLYLGFRAQGGSGSSLDYIVNIGQFSLYTSGASFTVGNFGSDLSSSSLFGASWNTNRGEGSNVFWGVIGTPYSTTGDTSTIYVSSPTSNTEAFTGLTPFSSLNTIGLIKQVSSGYLQNNGTVSTTNPKALVQGTGDSNSWSSFLQGNLDFNRFTEIEGNFALGTGSSDANLNLYRIDPVNGKAATLVGTFSISNAGVVTYTSAVPEPASLAYLGIAAVGAILLIRRRRALNA